MSALGVIELPVAPPGPPGTRSGAPPRAPPGAPPFHRALEGELARTAHAEGHHRGSPGAGTSRPRAKSARDTDGRDSQGAQEAVSAGPRQPATGRAGVPEDAAGQPPAGQPSAQVWLVDPRRQLLTALGSEYVEKFAYNLDGVQAMMAMAPRTPSQSVKLGIKEL